MRQTLREIPDKYKTIAAGGDKLLRNGMYSMFLGELFEIREVPGEGVGPNGRYKYFELLLIRRELGPTKPQGMKAIDLYSFEGFSVRNGSGKIMYVFDDLQTAIIEWMNRYEMVES